MLKSILVLVGVLSAASVAKADCIPVAELQKQNPNTASYIHEAKRGNFSISVYRKGQSFADLIEVRREGRCIVSIEPLTSDQFVSRYLEWPEIWIAEQEGADNEGMPVEGEEGAEQEQALTEGEMFPFLTLEGMAIGRKIYSGKIGRPDFKGRDKDFVDFKTDILDGMNQGVNFSGAYRITQIGCGSSCSVAILSDLRTGKQFNFPHGGEQVGPLSLKFSANSSLMISTWRSGDECVLESLTFDGAKWVTLAKPSLGKADLCYESIDDNIAAYKSKNGLPSAGTASSLKQDGAHDAGKKPALPTPTESAVSGTASPKLVNEYLDINFIALTDLYEAAEIIQACGRANYITKSEMEKLEAAFIQSRAEILRRNGQIDTDAAERAADSRANFHTPIMLMIVDNDVQKACDMAVSRFPPNIDNAKPRKKEVIDTEYYWKGLLIFPRNPRVN